MAQEESPDEIVLGHAPTRDTGVRYDKKGRSYGLFDLDIYTPLEIAQRLGINKQTILNAIKEGRLKAKNLGGPAGYRVTRNSLIAWLEDIDQS